VVSSSEQAPGMEVKLFILVQERTFADALSTRLEAEPDVEVVAALHRRAPSPRLFAGSPANVALIDGDLPDDAAFRLCEELYALGRAPHAIFLSSFSEPRRILRAIRAGAAGWVRKDESLDFLLQAIRGVARGETWLPPGQTGEVLRLLLKGPAHEQDGSSALFATLTPRQREVLACLAEGTDRCDVAKHLHVSPHTVRTHVQNLMAKLGVHSVLEAVALTRPQLVGELTAAGSLLRSEAR
jgi:DNA-binding NarL/FixJ family response regulator